MQLHKKIAHPLAAVVVALLGIRFAFSVSPRMLLGVGVTWYRHRVKITMTLLETVDHHGWLLSLLAAWTSNVFFAAAGLYLIPTSE